MYPNLDFGRSYFVMYIKISQFYDGSTLTERNFMASNKYESSGIEKKCGKNCKQY